MVIPIVADCATLMASANAIAEGHLPQAQTGPGKSLTCGSSCPGFLAKAWEGLHHCSGLNGHRQGRCSPSAHRVCRRWVSLPPLPSCEYM